MGEDGVDRGDEDGDGDGGGADVRAVLEAFGRGDLALEEAVAMLE
jgi:hypothetical protein